MIERKFTLPTDRHEPPIGTYHGTLQPNGTLVLIAHGVYVYLLPKQTRQLYELLKERYEGTDTAPAQAGDEIRVVKRVKVEAIYPGIRIDREDAIEALDAVARLGVREYPLHINKGRTAVAVEMLPGYEVLT